MPSVCLFAAVDYLLAPEAKFPGSIVQGLAGWFYLTRTLGYHPSQIIVGGDSYGAEVAISLTRYLLTDFPGYEGYDIEAHGARTGERPGALLLLSPYVDARNDEENRPACYERNNKKDIICLAYGQWGHYERGLFYGPEAQTITKTLRKDDPWFTFINMPDEELKNFPPMWVANGDNELLIDMGHAWVDRTKQLGVTVEHDILSYGVHDYWTLHTFLPEAKEVSNKVPIHCRPNQHKLTSMTLPFSRLRTVISPLQEMVVLYRTNAIAPVSCTACTIYRI